MLLHSCIIHGVVHWRGALAFFMLFLLHSTIGLQLGNLNYCSLCHESDSLWQLIATMTERRVLLPLKEAMSFVCATKGGLILERFSLWMTSLKNGCQISPLSIFSVDSGQGIDLASIFGDVSQS